MNKPIGAIDGDKFVGRMESIRDNARTIYARNAYNFVLDEVRSYIIPSDQGEATRLRNTIRRYNEIFKDVREKVRDACSEDFADYIDGIIPDGYYDHDTEVKRLLMALEKIEAERVEPYREQWERLNTIGDIAREALSSSHREDGKQPKMTHNDQFQLACLVKEYGAEAIIRLIPGITEER